VELRIVSAAAAGCGELRFQCAVAEKRRVLRRLAGRDGSQGTSADNEVAVVGNSRSESRSVRGTNAEPGPTACVGVESTRSSRSGWRASRSVSERRRGRCRRRREERRSFRRAGSTETSVRPASASVGSEHPEEVRKRPPPSPVGCKAVAWVCFVLFVHLYCGGVILPLNCCIFICIFGLIKNCFWPSVARGLNSDTTERVFCLTYY